MKHITSIIGKAVCLAAFSAVILVLVAGNCDAKDTAPPAKQTAQVKDTPVLGVTLSMDNAIEIIEGRVIQAAVHGDTEGASKWSQTLLAVHASRYVGPVGDMLANFKDASKKAPELIAIAMEVEEAVTPTRSYHVSWRGAATVAVFKGDTGNFRRCLVNQKIWDALWSWEETTASKSDLSEDSEALLLARNWVEAGCPAQVPEKIKPVVEMHKFQMTLLQLRPQLTASN
jgi:hypothetical protein